LQVRKFSSLSVVRTSNCPKHHPFGRRGFQSGCPSAKASSVRVTWIPVQTFLYVEKLRTALACIRPDVSASRPNDTQCSTKLQDLFPKQKYGKIAATIWTTWIPIQTHLSIRQVSQFKSKRLDASQHGPDARASDMEIACIISTVRTTISWSRRAKPLYGNYLQRTCHRPDDRATPSGRSSQTGKIFNEIFRILVAQLSVRTVPNFIKPDAHLNPRPKNRGP
jgi:hypothetical protein